MPDLPRDIVDAVGVPSVRGRGHRGRIHGSEGQKVRMGQYTRHVDQALRPILGGAVPLVLAANEPLASIYRSTATYAHLAPTTLRGNADTTPDADLAVQARSVLDGLYADQLRAVHAVFEERSSQGRAASDVAGIARAATYGMIDTVLVDIDDALPGSVDDSGAVSFSDDGTNASEDAPAGADGPAGYGVLDEIVRRVWLNGGRVLAVRREDVPGGGPVAAILRYAPFSSAAGNSG